MRVLVTGGAGFIGSALVKSLKTQGHTVKVIDSLSSQIHGDSETTRRTLLHSDAWNGVIFEHADIRDKAALERLLPDTDALVHLAAETGTGQSMYQIAHYNEVNVQATAALLELIAVRYRQVRRIVLASSRAVYGEGAYRDAGGTLLCPEPRSAERMRAGQYEPVGPNGETLTPVATPESLPPNPASVYAATKLANETLSRILAEAHGMDVTALRFQNVYGAGQSLQNPYTGILSIFSNRMRLGLPVNIFEDGLESRDFVHIGDAVRAVELALSSDVRGNRYRVFNIGSGAPTTVIEAAKLLREFLDSDSPLEVSGDFRAGDIRHCYADLRLSRQVLGFEPRISLNEGLRDFCAWIAGQPTFVDQSAKAQENSRAAAWDRCLDEDSMLRRLGSNAAANILTGVSSMVFQLALTAMAARSFDRATFSVWTLAVSMAALTPLFAINLSSVVTRQLIGVSITGGEQQQSMVVSAARRVALMLAAIAVLAIIAASVMLLQRSPELKQAQPTDFLLAVLVLTGGQLWQISLQPSFGWHYAHESNWPVAGMYVLIRCGALLAMWLGISLITGKFFTAALCVAVGQWLGLAVAEFGFFAPRVPPVQRGAELAHQMRDTTRLAMGFAFWSIAVAAIQYGLPPLMSLLETSDYNAFYLAYSLNLVLTGVVGSAGAALLAPMTRLRVRGQQHVLVYRLMWATLMCAAFLIVALTLFRASMHYILHYWSAGIADPASVNGYLYILGFQTLVRAMAIPFVSILSSAAKPMQLIAPSLLELGVAVCVAIPLGAAFGSKVFLAVLPIAGAASAVTTCSIATRIGGFTPHDRKQLLMRFCAAEAAALCLWQITSSLVPA